MHRHKALTVTNVIGYNATVQVAKDSRLLESNGPSIGNFVFDMDLNRKIELAIKLLQSIPQDGPIELSYSGGKDSDVILELAKMAGIPFEAIYKNTRFMTGQYKESAVANLLNVQNVTQNRKNAAFTPTKKK